MSRISWVYPSDGGEPYVKGTRHELARVVGGPTVLPDLPDFTSPIDGQRYSGRAGLRDHCARHDVVPTADLKGLPWLTTNSDMRSPEERKASRDHLKQEVIRHVDRNYRKYNHG